MLLTPVEHPCETATVSHRLRGPRRRTHSDRGESWTQKGSLSVSHNTLLLDQNAAEDGEWIIRSLLITDCSIGEAFGGTAPDPYISRRGIQGPLPVQRCKKGYAMENTAARRIIENAVTGVETMAASSRCWGKRLRFHHWGPSGGQIRQRRIQVRFCQ